MSLTTTQKTAIANAIAANPTLAAYAATGDDQPITDYFNGEDSASWVWKTMLTPAEYNAALAGNVFDDLAPDRATQWNYWTATGSQPLDPSLPNIREMILNTFGSAAVSVQATKTALIAASKRHPSRVEALLAEGDATLADPAVLTFVGPIDLATISNIRSGDYLL